jgi:hypothetical protein
MSKAEQPTLHTTTTNTTSSDNSLVNDSNEKRSTDAKVDYNDPSRAWLRQVAGEEASDDSFDEFIKVSDNVRIINRFIDITGKHEKWFMGRYQWSLWTLCGFGWLADQALLQLLSLIQTQAQEDIGYSTVKAGGVTSCYFAGLAVGASFWGIMSDIWGRKPAFLCTLSTAGLFAIFLGAQKNYAGICAMAAFMGTGTGGYVFAMLEILC